MHIPVSLTVPPYSAWQHVGRLQSMGLPCNISIITSDVTWTVMNVVPSHHYNDVIMSVMASQITSLTIGYSTVYSGTDERKHQSSASLAFVRGIYLSWFDFVLTFETSIRNFPSWTQLLCGISRQVGFYDKVNTNHFVTIDQGNNEMCSLYRSMCLIAKGTGLLWWQNIHIQCIFLSLKHSCPTNYVGWDRFHLSTALDFNWKPRQITVIQVDKTVIFG